MYPAPLNNLIESFKKLPGIGEKTAERMALCCLELDQDIIDLFSKSLISIKKDIKRCSVCNNLTDEDLCCICKNENRNSKIICVVEDPKNVFQFEKIGSFNGLYHVLGGLISPLDNINPEDINLETLAQEVFVSTYYLSHLFRREMGVTFSDYLAKVRVEKAKALLMEGVSVENTAEKVGYNDSNYFIKIFKKYVGITPAKYRKSIN